MMGTKQVIIDPEREYRDMTYNLDGNWIDVGSGRGGMINPLQIKRVPLDDDTNTYLEKLTSQKVWEQWHYISKHYTHFLD